MSKQRGNMDANESYVLTVLTDTGDITKILLRLGTTMRLKVLVVNNKQTL